MGKPQELNRFVVWRRVIEVDIHSNFIKRGFKENLVDSEFERARVKTWKSLLCQDSNRRDIKRNKRLLLVMTFHPALSGVDKIIDSLWPILHALEDMKYF